MPYRHAAFPSSRLTALKRYKLTYSTILFLCCVPARVTDLAGTYIFVLDGEVAIGCILVLGQHPMKLHSRQ